MQVHQIIKDIIFIAAIMVAFIGFFHVSERFMNWLDVRRRKRDPSGGIFSEGK